MKKLIILISILSIIFILGKNILPTNNYFFDFHDETQPARINQFVLNLKNFQIPPRIAPQFSFNLGFPVFNYYAPTSYWITSFFNLVSFSIINSLKISFILALIVAFLSMYSLTSSFFGFYQSIFASLLYVSSSWTAVEIFIRGNLAELWFLSLLPLAFWAVYRNSKLPSNKFFVLTVLILGASLTTHNVLSLVLLPLLIIFILINKNKKRNFFALTLSLFLSSYFFIPAILEINQTYASSISKHTNYASHLLCLWQLWTTPFWGYGGSGPDCINDGMPFMIGKPQIIFGILGLFFITYLIIKKNKNSLIYSYFIFLTITFIYLSTYLSYPLSLFFNQYLGFFQFPWRLLAFVVFGISFLASGIFFPKKLKKLEIVLLFLGLIILIYNSKFFTKYKISNEKFNKEFLSESYITNQVAYKVSEYLPKTVDYQIWLKHEPKKNQKYLIDKKLKSNSFVHYLNNEKPEIIINDYFYKKAKINKNEKIIINISYMPYWKIFVNNKQIIPDKFDSLGRPIISLAKDSILEVRYEQTLIQKVSNGITFFVIVYLVYLFFKTKKIIF